MGRPLIRLRLPVKLQYNIIYYTDSLIERDSEEVVENERKASVETHNTHREISL